MYNSTEEAQAAADKLGITLAGEGAITMDNENIIIDRARAREVGAYNVVGHELLHEILSKTLYNITKGKDGKYIIEGRGRAIGLADGLLKYLDKIDPNLIKDSNFKRRLEKFYSAKDIGKTLNAEETLILFGDAVLLGEINFNDTMAESVQGVWRRFLQNWGVKGSDIKFREAKDFVNFIRDYKVDLESGKASKAIKKLRTEGISGKENVYGEYTKDDIVDKTSKESISELDGKTKQSREEASDRVQQIYKQKGVDGSFEIIEEYRPMASKLAARFRDVPGYDINKDILVDEILTGKRGVIDLIKEYKSDQGVPLAAYINKFLRSRSIEAANRILDTKFKSDVTEARDVAASETAEDVVIEEEIRTKTKATKPTLRQRLKIKKDDKDYNKILEAANKVLSGKLLPVDSYEFRNAIQKDLFTLLKPTLANVMGTRYEYTKFLKDYRKDIIDQLDVKDLVAIERNEKNKIFTEVVEQNVSPKKLREYERSEDYDVTYKSETSGPTVYRKKTPNEKEFLEFYDIKGSKKGTRKDKLAELIGASLGFDAVPQLLQDEALVDRIKEIYKQRDITTPKDIKAEIINAVKREPGGKLSITEKGKIDEIIKNENIFQLSDINLSSGIQEKGFADRNYNDIINAAEMGNLDMTKPLDRAAYTDWIRNVAAKELSFDFFLKNSTLTGGSGKGNYTSNYAFQNKKEIYEALGYKRVKRIKNGKVVKGKNNNPLYDFVKNTAKDIENGAKAPVQFFEFSKTITKEQKKAALKQKLPAFSDYDLVQDMLTKVGVTTGSGINRVLSTKFKNNFGSKKFNQQQRNSLQGLKLVMQGA